MPSSHCTEKMAVSSGYRGVRRPRHEAAVALNVIRDVLADRERLKRLTSRCVA